MLSQLTTFLATSSALSLDSRDGDELAMAFAGACMEEAPTEFTRGRGWPTSEAPESSSPPAASLVRDLAGWGSFAGSETTAGRALWVLPRGSLLPALVSAPLTTISSTRGSDGPASWLRT